jgi:hypothetical protein
VALGLAVSLVGSTVAPDVVLLVVIEVGEVELLVVDVVEVDVVDVLVVDVEVAEVDDEDVPVPLPPAACTFTWSDTLP